MYACVQNKPSTFACTCTVVTCTARPKKKKIIIPQYELPYFNMRGRAALTRLIFKAAGVERGVIFKTEENWKRASLTERFTINRYLFASQNLLQVEGLSVPVNEGVIWNSAWFSFLKDYLSWTYPALLLFFLKAMVLTHSVSPLIQYFTCNL